MEMQKCGNTETEKCQYLVHAGQISFIVCHGSVLYLHERARLLNLPAMATAPARCELIDLTMSSSDVDLPIGSKSDESVIVTEVIRYVENNKTMFGLVTFFGRLQC